LIYFKKNTERVNYLVLPFTANHLWLKSLPVMLSVLFGHKARRGNILQKDKNVRCTQSVFMVKN